MKNTLLILLFFTSSCKKEDTIEPIFGKWKRDIPNSYLTINTDSTVIQESFDSSLVSFNGKIRMQGKTIWVDIASPINTSVRMGDLESCTKTTLIIKAGFQIKYTKVN